MSEDVKTLREAACAIPGGGMLSACERAALAILCARMADMIEREERPAKTSPFTRHIEIFKGCEPMWAEAGWRGKYFCVRTDETGFATAGPFENYEAACKRSGFPIDGNTLVRKVGEEMVGRMTALVLDPTPDALQAAEDRIAVLETHLGETLKMLEAAYRQIGIHPDGKPRFVAARSALRREPRT